MLLLTGEHMHRYLVGDRASNLFTCPRDVVEGLREVIAGRLSYDSWEGHGCCFACCQPHVAWVSAYKYQSRTDLHPHCSFDRCHNVLKIQGGCQLLKLLLQRPRMSTLPSWVGLFANPKATRWFTPSWSFVVSQRLFCSCRLRFFVLPWPFSPLLGPRDLWHFLIVLASVIVCIICTA